MNGKTTLDLTAFGGSATAIATANGGVPAWMDWLPYIAAALSIIWLTMRTVDWLYARFKPKKE